MLPYKLLIVDDAPDNIAILHNILSPLGCKIFVANAGAKALEMIARTPPDLILLDVMMPEMDGFEVCRQLRADKHTAAIPIIFVTAKVSDVSEGFAAGGNDYIPKPINPAEVLARVRHQLERLSLLRELTQTNERLEQTVQARTAELLTTNRQLREEINERRFMQDRLRYLAEHDFVTRVYNRNALDAHTSALLAKIQINPEQEAAYLQLDLDQFRLINESMGCIAGDELLHQIAELLSGSIAQGDFLARLGGDNFALVCENHSEIEGLALAKRIQEQIANYLFQWEGKGHSISASIALVHLTPKITRFEQLLMMADETLYLAKQNGRGTIACYDEHTPDAIAHRNNIHWALRLAGAIRNNQLKVFAQRIYPNTTNPHAPHKIKVEALVRLWDEQNQKIIQPEEVIPVAERFDLVQDVDRWMIENVAAFLANHRELHAQIDCIAINLSARTLNDPKLHQFILDTLQRHELPAQLIAFEITETERLNDIEHIQLFMHNLRSKGFRFALDDFGSGYASMNYLHDLPFDIVKIDGHLVHDIDRNGAHAAIVYSLIEIARTLDKEVVLENVQSQQISMLVQGFDAQWCQGYHFHKPELLSKAIFNSLTPLQATVA